MQPPLSNGQSPEVQATEVQAAEVQAAEEAPNPAALVVSDFLTAVGAPSDDPELARTPERVSRLWRENLLLGQHRDPAEPLSRVLPATSRSVITLTGLPFHSLCPHHLLPYDGVVHLAYEPGEHIVGLGALEEVVLLATRRLVLQETVTELVVEALMRGLGARGAACAVDARHLCLILRGREPRSARVHTRAMAGSLEGRSDVLPPVAS